MRFFTCTVFVLSIIALINGLPFEDGNSDELGPLSRLWPSCLAWYFTQGDPNVLLAQTPKPPCTVPTSFPNPLPGGAGWTVDPECDPSKYPNSCSFHKGAHGCYRNAFHTTGPGAQACYDQTGKWISDPEKGAGTVDKETPLGDAVQQVKHFTVDVLPYLDCCDATLIKTSAACKLYYKKRPPGTCA